MRNPYSHCSRPQSNSPQIDALRVSIAGVHGAQFHFGRQGCRLFFLRSQDVGNHHAGEEDQKDLCIVIVRPFPGKR